MMQAYFDESGTHRGAPVTCVAGYLFTADQCLRFETEWKQALDDYAIPHFHMADCANGGKFFRGWPISRRDELERRLIGIIKRRATIGVVASVRPEDHANFSTPELVGRGGSYVLCLLWCVAGVAAWVAKHGYSGKIAYFFESGHQLASRADQAMQWLSKRPVLRDGSRYRAHSFVSKELSLPVQAADILAWQWYKDWSNRVGAKRRPRRLDLSALLSLPHMSSHLTTQHLEAMVTDAGQPRPDFFRRFDFVE
jgi:hypothetical protein